MASNTYQTPNQPIDWATLSPDFLTVESNGAGAFEVIARREPPHWDHYWFKPEGYFLACLAVRPCYRTAKGYADALSRVRGVPLRLSERNAHD